MSPFSRWSTGHRPREYTRIHLGEPGGWEGFQSMGEGWRIYRAGIEVLGFCLYSAH